MCGHHDEGTPTDREKASPDEDEDGDDDENKDVIPSENNCNHAEHKTF